MFCGAGGDALVSPHWAGAVGENSENSARRHRSINHNGECDHKDFIMMMMMTQVIWVKIMIKRSPWWWRWWWWWWWWRWCSTSLSMWTKMVETRTPPPKHRINPMKFHGLWICFISDLICFNQCAIYQLANMIFKICFMFKSFFKQLVNLSILWSDCIPFFLNLISFLWPMCN